jgi:S1-C subfamily serine protease
MAYVASRTSKGEHRIGSAFHVGEGIFVTARHVVENHEIIEVKPTRELRLPIKEVIPDYPDEQIETIKKITGKEPSSPVFQSALKVLQGPFYLKDPRVDVAVFAVDGLHAATPHVILGRHLDDWIFRREFVMSDAIILGYPPIPMTKDRI